MQHVPETTPLLRVSSQSRERTRPLDNDEGDNSGEAFDALPKEKRQLGLTSAVFLIFNRIIGTGIYATPSVILRSSGSVGVALLMWLIGALVASAGTAVYIELGTGLPRSGGEKNYLEFVFRKPEFLATCIFAVYAPFLGSAAANSIVFGQYVLNALSIPLTAYNSRMIAVGCLTFILIIHSTSVKAGLRLQNALGIFKLFVLSAIALLGILYLLHFPGMVIQPGMDQPHNFDSWHTLWEGSSLTNVNAFVNGMYSVIWAYIGYANANLALSEVKDPVQTIKKAAPLAIVSVTVAYLLVNVAYFAVVSKNDILQSKQIVAALFFRNIFGARAEKFLSVIISLSLLGNLLAGQFTFSRVMQELGREGLVPLAAFFASNKPFGAPFPGLLLLYLLSTTLVLVVPPGDAYVFFLNLSSYATALVNVLVTAGLLLLHTSWYRTMDWSPPFQAYKPVVLFFFASNIFLVMMPLIPPTNGNGAYDSLPYWLHVAVGISLSLVGTTYWYVRCVWMPRRGGYVLQRTTVVQDDGVPRSFFVKVSPNLLLSPESSH